MEKKNQHRNKFPVSRFRMVSQNRSESQRPGGRQASCHRQVEGNLVLSVALAVDVDADAGETSFSFRTEVQKNHYVHFKELNGRATGRVASATSVRKRDRNSQSSTS